MPPRRSHKKSKAGCLRCKQRKIKCDEVHPLCGNCEKHGVSCDFESQPASTTPIVRRQSTASEAGSFLVKYAASSSSAASPASTSINSIGSPSTSIDSSNLSRYAGSSRMLEMRLLHHYTALTARTLASNCTPEMEQAWVVSVPNMAFESPCLMDALFAVSALHLRTMIPSDQALVRASHGYMASAISQYSDALQSGVTAANAEALFTTSAMVAFQASAARCFREEAYGAGNQYQLPLAWFHSFQGVKAVVLASWRYIRLSERVRPIIHAQPPLQLDLNPSRPVFFGPLLHGVEDQLSGMEEAKKKETRQAYEHAVAFLNWSHQKPERARILGFPATVSKRFVELIADHDPRTLVIIACFFAMTAVVDDVWWLNNIAKREVEGILTLLPKEWWGRMQWPLRVANYKGVMDEETWGDCWHTEGIPDNGFNGDVHDHIDQLVDMNPAMPYGFGHEHEHEPEDKPKAQKA